MSQSPFLNSEDTELMFIKFLRNVEALWLLLMRAFACNFAFCFGTPQQTTKAVNFDVCQKPTKLILTIATSLGLQQNLYQFHNPIHTSINVENLMKIG